MGVYLIGKKGGRKYYHHKRRGVDEYFTHGSAGLRIVKKKIVKSKFPKKKM